MGMKMRNDFIITFKQSKHEPLGWRVTMGDINLSFHVALNSPFARTSYMAVLREHLKEDRTWTPAWKGL